MIIIIIHYMCMRACVHAYKYIYIYTSTHGGRAATSRVAWPEVLIFLTRSFFSPFFRLSVLLIVKVQGFVTLPTDLAYKIYILAGY
jgi:hypothetical protein